MRDRPPWHASGVPSVLVVEDDGVIARAIAAHLRHAGLDVVLAEDGEKGLRKLRFEQHDVAIVDLMLPGVDGWALTQEARREGIATPILIVSARGSEHDKVHALEIGADDYLAKPFGMRELVARTQALLRRTRSAPDGGDSLDEPIDAPGLAIDPAGRRAFLLDEAGARIDAELTPTEFRLLFTLARQPGRVLSRDELQQRVWNVPYRARDRSVDVCVRKLREKLDRRSTHSYIQTQYGVGYRFDPTPH
jgi:DNA-binding response OmpR family regulator